MGRSTGFILAWIGATVVAVTVATAAVGSVRSNVTEIPTVLGTPVIEVAVGTGNATSTTLAPLVLDEPKGVTTTTPPTTTTTTTTGTAPGRTTTTSTSPPTATTTTTVPTATTTQLPEASTKTFDTAAGTVRIRVEGESVTLVNVRPNTGWRVYIEYAGPEDVEVRFAPNDEDDDSEVEFFATFVRGELKVTIAEE